MPERQRLEPLDFAVDDVRIRRVLAPVRVADRGLAAGARLAVEYRLAHETHHSLEVERGASQSVDVTRAAGGRLGRAPRLALHPKCVTRNNDCSTAIARPAAVDKSICANGIT